MPKLQITIASTRSGRKGPAVSEWFLKQAKAHGGFDCEVIDLAEVNLPFMDEPNLPRLGKYEHAHTKAWSATISSGDAFVFILPEYNYSFPATIKNALDYLSKEWQQKPLGIVSYGGMAAGTRAVQQLQPVVQALQLRVMSTLVNLQFFTQYFDESGTTMTGDEKTDKAAQTMLDEMVLWEGRLRPFRQ